MTMTMTSILKHTVDTDSTSNQYRAEQSTVQHKESKVDNSKVHKAN